MNKRSPFLQKRTFGFFFFKIMLESWGCGLYTSAPYTRVFTVLMKDILLDFLDLTLKSYMQQTTALEKVERRVGQ